MGATAETTELPFPERRIDDTMEKSGHESNKDWFLALRHVRVPFHPSDRLLLLYGHPLVSRLGLFAATERVLAGEPVVYLDGANTFDPFVIGRLARAHHKQPRKVLAMIHVARAYTGHQLERLMSDCLGAALDRYEARLAVLSGLIDTFYDKAMPEQEALRLFGRMMEAIARLTQQGVTVLCLCPPKPVLTPIIQRCLYQVRSQADRVIRVQESSGIVRLEEEGRKAGESWEVVRSVLEQR